MVVFSSMLEMVCHFEIMMLFPHHVTSSAHASLAAHVADLKFLDLLYSL